MIEAAADLPLPDAAADGAPDGMLEFARLGLAESLQRAVAAQGYTVMTPIQAKAIPIVLAGRDVMGAAQTGTGKTAAFSLPLLHKMLRHENASMSPARHPVRALVIAPTRELADQVASNIKGYAAQTKLRVAVVYGGIDMKPQTLELKAAWKSWWPHRGGCWTTSRPRTACSIMSSTCCSTRRTACWTSVSCPICSAS